jgi:hypothetical protein
MGEKSETFCRRTLVTMNEHSRLIPAEVDVAEAMRDMSVRLSRKARATESPAQAV